MIEVLKTGIVSPYQNYCGFREVSTPKVGFYKNLTIVCIEEPDRLGQIRDQVQSWGKKACSRVSDKFRTYEEFGPISGSQEIFAASSYYQICDRVYDFVVAKLRSKQGEQGLQLYKVVAAYDEKRLLQGVLIGHRETFSNGASVFKIDGILTAFRNMPFNAPKSPDRTKGVGTCLLNKVVIDATVSKDQKIEVEAVEDSNRFYLAVGFESLYDKKFAVGEQVNRLVLLPKQFSIIEDKAKAQFSQCNEKDL